MARRENEIQTAPDASEPAASGNTEAPRLPGFRTWPGVYCFVLGLFVLYIILLAILSQTFS